MSGTNSASSGVWRPTIAPRSSFGSPVISASVTIGIAPKATGAVLATSATAAACIGLKPSAMSMTAVIATGVPGLDGHVVDPDRVDDDPHDREEAERGALRGRQRDLTGRHRVDRHGDDGRDTGSLDLLVHRSLPGR
jgi:hypothetical protein